MDRLLSVWRVVRHGRDRWRHAARRRAAIAGLRAWRPRRVVVVCHGNICRSPFAAALLARGHLPAAGIAVTSAGFVGPGRSPPPLAVAAARRHGVNLSEHRSALLDGLTLGPDDLVVVMEPRQVWGVRRRGAGARGVLLLGDLDPKPIETRTIVDPVLGTADVFAACYQRIARCAVVLAACLSGSIAEPDARAGCADGA